MAKVNVSLPDELLAQVDELAKKTDRSRSGFVQEAAGRYIASLREEEALRERERRVAKAASRIKDLAEGLPTFDGTAAIRQDRGRDAKSKTSKEDLR